MVSKSTNKMEAGVLIRLGTMGTSKLLCYAGKSKSKTLRYPIRFWWLLWSIIYFRLYRSYYMIHILIVS